MATINNLNVSILNMPLKEAFQIILNIRKNRLIRKMNKFNIRADKAKTKTKDKKKKINPLDNVSKQELLVLLKESLNEQL